MITLAKRGITSGKENPAQEVHARRLAAARIARYRVVEDADGNVEEVDVVKKLLTMWPRVTWIAPADTHAW